MRTSTGWLTPEQHDAYQRQTLIGRLSDSARYRAAQLGGYKVRGMRAVDTVTPSSGVAWFQLTFGNLVLVVNGMDDQGEWFHTLAEAEGAYLAAKAQLRSTLPLGM